MKLLMITGLGSARDLVAGKKGAFYYTLEEFCKYWDRIDIISPRVAGFSSGTKVIFGNVFVHVSPWPLFLHPFWFLKNGKELYNEQKFDLMTVHEFPPFYNGIGARLLWNKIRVPYVLEIHHIPGHPKAASIKELLYQLVMRWFIRYDAANAQAVRVVNQHQAPEFLIRAGVLAGKIKYIPSAYIDLNVFRPTRPVRSLARTKSASPEDLGEDTSNGVPVDKKYDLVFAARLEKNKGINLLLEALSVVIKTIPNTKLLIIGSGPERQNLEHRIKSLELNKNVFFSGWLGTRDDVARAYNSARIFINPSFNEGGPRVMLEAMACGLPVITTPVGLACDLIKDGETGLVTDWDQHQMADKILLLLNDHEIQTKFSRAGLELVKQFEKEAAIKNYGLRLRQIF